MESRLIKKQQSKKDNVRFISKVLTPLNPKDMYYVNVEQQIKSYFGMILIGLFMVMYMVFY